MKYDTKLRGNFPAGEYVPGMTGLEFVRSGFDKFDKWNMPMLCQEKLDGWFGIVVKDKSECYWDNGWKQYGTLQGMLAVFDAFMPKDSIIVGEVGYGTEAETRWAAEHGYNRFIMFDVLQWDGEWWADKPAIERYNKLKEIFEASKYAKEEAPQIQIVETVILDDPLPGNNSARAWKEFRKIYDHGGEGIVLKEMAGTYNVGRDSNNMYKIKKYLTKDFVCIGFEESDAPTFLAKGMKVAAIRCGLYVKGELKFITQTSGFSFEMRKEFTDHPEKYIGKVCELGGFEIFKSGAMRHSMFLRFREDRKPEECVL